MRGNKTRQTAINRITKLDRNDGWNNSRGREYEEVVGGFDNSPFQSEYRTGDAAPFKDSTPNRNDNSMASMLRPAMRNSNLSLAEETKESQAMVVTVSDNG